MNNNLSSGKMLAFRLIAFFIGLLLIFSICEVFFRLMPALVADPPATPPYNYRDIDPTYGWVVRENYRHEGEMKDFKGQPYPLLVTFGKNGFRKWGDPSVSGKKKILFVGDSYTACAQTSDDKLWYKYIGDSLNVEVFAYGAAGYGNTQEVMAVQRFAAEIKPDLVVWQFCCNDFLDNYWEMEKNSTYHVRMKRPYTMEDGSIRYELAAEYPRNVKPYSYFLYFILKKIAMAKGTFDKNPENPAEKRIAEENEQYPEFAQCLRMTAAAMKNMRAALPAGTKLLAFDADAFEPQYKHIARLCKENEIPFVEGLPQYLNAIEQKGECVRTDDGYHWNNRGNELGASFLGKAIAQAIKQ